MDYIKVPIQRENDAESLKEEVAEAWAFVKTQPWLFAGIAMFMIWHIGDSAIEIGIPFIVENKGLGAKEFGIFGAVGAGGAMIGSLLAGIRPIPQKSRGLVFYADRWHRMVYADVGDADTIPVDTSIRSYRGYSRGPSE